MSKSKKINLFEVINWLNENESWTNTSSEVNAKANLTIKEIEKIEEESMIFKGYEDFSALIGVAAYLRFDIFLRMFNELGIKQSGFGGDALLFCHDGMDDDFNNSQKTEMNVVLQRISLMIRAEVVNRIFGEDNRKRVLSAIEDIKKEKEGLDE